jgi:hypothetical protein
MSYTFYLLPQSLIGMTITNMDKFGLCVFVYIYRPPLNTSINNALNKIQFIKLLKLLHVSAPGCHPQGFIKNGV